MNDDIYAVVCKSTSSDLGLLRIDHSGSEDNTPTEEVNVVLSENITTHAVISVCPLIFGLTVVKC